MWPRWAKSNCVWRHYPLHRWGWYAKFPEQWNASSVMSDPKINVQIFRLNKNTSAWYFHSFYKMVDITINICPNLIIFIIPFLISNADYFAFIH